MTFELELPDLGTDVQECTIVEWLVDPGDVITEDEAVVEVETEKEVVKVPSPADGTVRELRCESGDVVAVGEVVAVLDLDDDADGAERLYRRAVDTDATLDDNEVEALIELLDSDDASARRWAAKAFSEAVTPPERAGQPLVDALRDEDRGVRKHAIGAVEELSETAPDTQTDAVDPLIDLLGEESAVPGALGTIGARRPSAVFRAIGPLAELLEDDKPHAIAAASALEAIGTAAHPASDVVVRIADAVAEQLRSDREETRRLAASLLVELADTAPDAVADVRDELERCVHDGEPSSVRNAAEAALTAVDDAATTQADASAADSGGRIGDDSSDEGGDWPAPGDVVVGTVDEIAEFGVFVDLDEYDEYGLVHVNEVAEGWVKNVRDRVEEGNTIAAAVLDVDSDAEEIDLSLKDVNDAERAAALGDGEGDGDNDDPTADDTGGDATADDAGAAREFPSADVAEPATPGSIAFEDVDVGDRIGQGGNADVFEATVGDTPIALKQPRAAGTLHRETIERFQEEADTWHKLDDHKGIVTVYDYGAEPMPWIAMEYMNRGDLTAVRADLDLAGKLWVAVQLVRAVRHAHRRGVAHLDLKPENVLFRSTPEGQYPYPKVADWGLAKMLLERSQSVEGLSPQYAAPEQFDSDQFGRPDADTDVYQLGAVCYELFTGQPPYTGSSAAVMHAVLSDDPTPPTAVDPDLPTALDDVLLRSLAVEKANRYEAVVDFRRDLESVLASVR